MGSVVIVSSLMYVYSFHLHLSWENLAPMFMKELSRYPLKNKVKIILSLGMCKKVYYYCKLNHMRWRYVGGHRFSLGIRHLCNRCLLITIASQIYMPPCISQFHSYLSLAPLFLLPFAYLLTTTCRSPIFPPAKSVTQRSPPLAMVPWACLPTTAVSPPSRSVSRHVLFPVISYVTAKPYSVLVL